MGNYSSNEGMVKVDFYRVSGKWYMTEAWDMSKFYNERMGPVEAVEKMLSTTERGVHLMEQFIVVVDEPYHAQAYPVMLVKEEWWRAIRKECPNV